mgnify:CR=1 FL=1
MKLKIMAFALAALSATGISAQGKYANTTINDRIGHGQDSVAVLEHLSMYTEDYRNKNYESAYESWKFVLEHAPLAQVRIYQDGSVILMDMYQKAKAAGDAAKMTQYADELMKLYDIREANIDDLNSFASEMTKQNRGNVICRKAYDYAVINGYTEEAYQMFRSGIDDMGPNTEAFVLFAFIQCSYNRYVTNKENDTVRQDFIDDYFEVNDICDRLLDQAKAFVADTLNPDTVSAQKIVMAYQPTQDKCNELFNASGAADCNALTKIYTSQVDANKNNLAYLRSVMRTLQNFDCGESEIYYRASEYAYALNKTPESAIGKAQKAMKSGNSGDALKYFNEAIANESNPAKKAKISMNIANIMYKRGNISEARRYCRQTLSYDPSNGNAYLLQANCISRSVPSSADALTRSGYYCLATDYCDKAKRVDPACAARANRMIASLSAGYYPRSEAFFQGIKEGKAITVMGETTTLRMR